MALCRVKRSLLCVSFLSLAAWAQPPQPAQFIPNQYILLLEDAPVSARFVSREQMQTAAGVAYRNQVEARQRTLRSELASRNIKVTGSVSTVLNAIFVAAPPERLDELKALSGVAAVRPMRRGHRDLNKATQLMNAPAAWNAIGGQQNAGKGIRIAIVDSGIDQTHPAFQDSSLTVPAGFPKCNVPSDCLNYTSNKVIVARSYVSQIAAGTSPTNPAADSTPDDYSARDRDGHGTAVASAAAANTSTGSVTFSGMAPEAYLGSYKVYGSPGVNDYPPESIWIQAIEDALNDGMDIAVFSSGVPALSGPLDGGGCPLNVNTAFDPLAVAFECAARSGLVVVSSAGNEGEYGAQYPNFGTVESPAFAPSVLAVGATTNSHVLLPTVSAANPAAPQNLKNLAAQISDSYSVLYTGLANAQSAPLIDVTRLGNDGHACSALPAGSLNGAFALILRGGPSTCLVADEANNAEAAGAIGAIFYMADSSAPVVMEGVDQFYGTVVMISNSDGLALKSYVDANPGAVVTIDQAGREEDLATYSSFYGFSPPLAANELASYSSLGPSTGTYAIKPDLVATGGLDISLYADPGDQYLPTALGIYLAAESYDPLGTTFSPNRYVAAEGTSFAAPLVAGAAALVKYNHPNYTAAQIRSALVNTAAQDVTVDDFGDAVDVKWTGAGRLDAGAAVNALVTAEPSTISFGALKSGSALPQPIPLTITNHGTASVTLAASVVVAAQVTGISVALDKQSLTLGPTGSSSAAATLNVSLSGAVPAAGSYSGVVTLTGSGISMRIPYLFLVGSGLALNANLLYGGGDGIAGQDLGYFAVSVTDANGVAVAGSPVSFSVSPRNSVKFQSVQGEPACSPTSSTTSISCPTDNYGIAYVDVVLGPNPASLSINVATAEGLPWWSPASVTSRLQPTINTGGILPAANVDVGTPVAPGSYAAIYGLNLSDYSDQAAYVPLPLSIDGVTVSFDVPSAHISVPGRVLYVGSGQVNVQVPWELQGQSSAQVKVTINEYEFGNVVTASLAAAAPAFFHAVADALDLNYQMITSSNPAKRGQVIQLFANGLGPVTNQPASGDPAPGAPNLAVTTFTPVVTIGGQTAPVTFSGLSPGAPGLYQVNVTVPSNITAGSSVPITIAVGSQTSKAATIPVQ